MTNAWSRRAVMSGAACSLLTVTTARAAQAPALPVPPQGVQSFDPAFDALVAPGAAIEPVMTGFTTSEGPLWVGGADGYLLVSDVGQNLIRRWSAKGGEAIFLSPSGYAGPPSLMLREGGANGLILARGGLVMADQGNRGIAHVDMRTKRKTMLCRDFEGRRFNSPNDLVLARDGSIYFTDPTYGLVGGPTSPYRELDYTGVFRLAPDDTVTLVDRTVSMPNGIGISPDHRTLYSTSQGIGWPAWTLDGQGRASDKRFFVESQTTGVAGGDGLKIDAAGNMWTSSRDGVSVINPQGRRIGLISLGGRGANCEIGADGYLYIVSGPRVMRVATTAKKLVF